MSFLVMTAEYIASLATDLANVYSTISLANMAALAPTTGALATSGNAVSAALAALFVMHTQAYQALSTQAALFHN
ncbi:PE family protein [Mycobacterium lepromatosis]|nr:PE family protein [Mycobacterium lepromatosis]